MVKFYSVSKVTVCQGTFSLIDGRGMIKRTRLSEISWSPNGLFLVLAGVKQGYGEQRFEFFFVDKMVPAAVVIESAAKISWDPSGRYLSIINSGLLVHVVISQYLGRAWVQDLFLLWNTAESWEDGCCAFPMEATPMSPLQGKDSCLY